MYDNVTYCAVSLPSALLKAVTGVRINWESYVVFVLQKRFVGDEAIAQQNRFYLEYPIQRGLITDWDQMEKVYTLHVHYIACIINNYYYFRSGIMLFTMSCVLHQKSTQFC